MKKLFDLKNKIALITGGTSGLGKAMAMTLSNFGATIIIFDNKNFFDKTVLRKLGKASKFYQVDISNEEEVKKAFQLVKKEYKKVDILVNNAGIFYPTPIEKTSKDDWEKLLSVNVTGYFIITKHCVNLMNKGSKIINISSVAGHHAFKGATAYNASKGAVIQMTKSMAIEYAPRITVNAICPGFFKTPMTTQLLQDKTIQGIVRNAIPLKRAGEDMEIGGLAVYLSSEASNYMTGSIITLDGGWTCHL